MADIKALGTLIKGLFLSSPPTLSNGQESPLILSSTGALVVQTSSGSPTNPTYVCSFNGITAPAGQFFELVGASGVVGRVIEIYFFKPSASVIFTALAQTVASTGGTTTASTKTKLDQSDSAASLTTKLYTAAPTAGTAAGNFVQASPVTAGDILGFSYGDGLGKPIVVRNGQSLALSVDASAVVYGYVMWTEAAT